MWPDRGCPHDQYGRSWRQGGRREGGRGGRLSTDIHSHKKSIITDHLHIPLLPPSLPPSPPSPVDILLNVVGNVKVDHMLHVRDVQPTGRHCRGNQEWGAACLEAVQGSLTVTLCAVTMDTGDWVTL